MENKDFETLLKELEVVVKKLEDKEISLDDAIKNYQLGLALSKACYEKLENAKNLVVKEIK